MAQRNRWKRFRYASAGYSLVFYDGHNNSLSNVDRQTNKWNHFLKSPTGYRLVESILTGMFLYYTIRMPHCSHEFPTPHLPTDDYDTAGGLYEPSPAPLPPKANDRMRKGVSPVAAPRRKCSRVKMVIDCLAGKVDRNKAILIKFIVSHISSGMRSRGIY